MDKRNGAIYASEAMSELTNQLTALAEKWKSHYPTPTGAMGMVSHECANELLAILPQVEQLAQAAALEATTPLADALAASESEALHLTLALHAADSKQQAAVAAAYEAAAQITDDEGREWMRVHQEPRNKAAQDACTQASYQIRALATANERAALGQVKARAKLALLKEMQRAGETSVWKMVGRTFWELRITELEAAVKRNADE